MLLVYLGGPQSGCFKLKFSPDGQWIASSCAIATLKIGVAGEGMLEKTLFGHELVSRRIKYFLFLVCSRNF